MFLVLLENIKHIKDRYILNILIKLTFMISVSECSSLSGVVMFENDNYSKES